MVKNKSHTGDNRTIKDYTVENHINKKKNHAHENCTVEMKNLRE